MTGIDVQALRLQGSFKLSRVGIAGVHKPVMVKRNGRRVQLNVELEVAVDLPASLRGSHLSRNAEAIGAMVDETVREPVEGLEQLTRHLAERLMELHDYASMAEVHAQADYFIERTFAGRTSLEPYRLVGRGLAFSREPSRAFIGVEVVGLTACPCAMEETRKLKGSAEDIYISHNQRNLATLMVEQTDPPMVEADRLIDIVEASVSAPTFDTLKRRAEAELVLQAHSNPRFVEDVVRQLLKGLLVLYPDLPGSTAVEATSRAMESIHKHDAFAERVATVAQLRA